LGEVWWRRCDGERRRARKISKPEVNFGMTYSIGLWMVEKSVINPEDLWLRQIGFSVKVKKEDSRMGASPWTSVDPYVPAHKSLTAFKLSSAVKPI